MSLEKQIVHPFKDGSFALECAFCEGGGVYPGTIYRDDIETELCPVCQGKGINTFKTSPENVTKCRYCGGNGRAWNSNGYFAGDICQVCHGTGIVTLEQTQESLLEEVLLWQLIHPEITEVARSRFESGHYADSVEAAFKKINAIVKEIVKLDTGEELDGAALMNRAFSLRQPIICIGDLSTESGRNIQKGYMQIFAGSMTGIRNPKAHDNLEVDRLRAIHFLCLASLLMSKLDERT